MDSVEAFVKMPTFATGFLTCVLCRRVQGWIKSSPDGPVKASDFIPAHDYPPPLPTSGQSMVCAWCGGPCIPHAANKTIDEVRWKVDILHGAAS